MKIGIYGNDKYSVLLKDIVEKEYSALSVKEGGEEITVPFFVTERPSGEGEISFDEFALKYKNGEFAAIIIPKENCIHHNSIILKLLRMGIDVNDIYNGARLFGDFRNHAENIPFLATPVPEDSYLSYLEYHVADHCNLNCKYCTHYSPLVKEPVFTDLKSFINDLSKLHEFIKDIGVIRILGGEPLLNPELPRFIEETRKIYPGSIIYVVTNGLLIEKCSEELFAAMRDNQAFFHISFYPPFENSKKHTEQLLVENKIPYIITEKTEYFDCTQCLEGNNNPDFFYSCFQATCTCIQDGKIAPCYAPFTTKYLNEAFSLSLPTDEGIDIYDEELTLQELKLRLLIPMERCNYCINGARHPWEVVGKHSELKDWI